MALDASFQNLLASLAAANLAPGSTALIPKDFTPSVHLNLTYGHQKVSLGNVLRTSETTTAPIVTFDSEVYCCVVVWLCGPPHPPRPSPKPPSQSQHQNECKSDSSLTRLHMSVRKKADGTSYTLLLVDPDAPTPEDPKFAYWRHWIVTGLTGSTSQDAALAATAYLGPGPKDATASPHRYLFLLFREPAGFKFARGEVGGDAFVERRSFDAAGWAAGRGLVLVGVEWFSGVGDL
ncbi:uncharacterized protein L3040_005363 [Drepanopeziza brunnea f. sp. 'multigermtubi']|uniref:Phosphatidylethanolamine-binding protein n=1 Tax=Marssonina brunnea f. sp. multigermtubi (strain MB_m1) TaxID=1072389 RepID=K1WXB9_MARBU|nr:phosphatidylethanolamine-binding protein [Drepanopeziza brunnea f. sp. 'multigermtubi' MB_m1]EKD17142.1 phosphatidylethanolamine-binding protein [Drepanopeziza brunnea f. sp. 'multigermtubi' MB_m1]KAJ5041796.1 hypothetical protein L3040_005363 [Drepanopeziza brunnea f. sp. 'multigermtubi']